VVFLERFGEKRVVLEIDHAQAHIPGSCQLGASLYWRLHARTLKHRSIY